VRFKLDENLGTRGKAILAAAGHDACTVADQSLTSYEDHAIIERCKAEDRCLVTLDLDFANPLVFQPSLYSGIAVLRAPPHPSLADLERLVENLAKALPHETITGKLWIVETSRIRVYQEQSSD
jgi:predicted nuclease of predicted toxin-antitoxin system